MSCLCHAPHRGPVLTLAWNTALELASRVVVGPGANRRLPDVLKQLHSGSRVLLIAQPGAAEHLAEDLRQPLGHEGFDVTAHVVPDGESCKEVEHLLAIWDLLQEHQYDRQDTLVAIGGGAVCDLAGFAASTFKRGLNLCLVPTTLLAQVDAAIGGKNAVNLARGKNLAGTFYFPRAVLVDPLSLATLSSRQFTSGMAEVIKYALIEATVAACTDYTPGPRPLLDVLEEAIGGGFGYEDPALTGILISSIKMKLLVVGADPHESGLRRTLNLGHTLGHALEKVSGYQLTHGEAIAIGMVFAGKMSVRKGLIGSAEFERLRAVLLKAGLPVDVPAGLERRLILDAMGQDKKKQGDAIKFVLPKARLGCVDYGVNISLAELEELL
ncbi:MAG TPA: 3-dehydroquinate synthase [Candidatus Obscuribacterales bacterium]